MYTNVFCINVYRCILYKCIQMYIQFTYCIYIYISLDINEYPYIDVYTICLVCCRYIYITTHVYDRHTCIYNKTYIYVHTIGVYVVYTFTSRHMYMLYIHSYCIYIYISLDQNKYSYIDVYTVCLIYTYVVM